MKLPWCDFMEIKRMHLDWLELPSLAYLTQPTILLHCVAYR